MSNKVMNTNDAPVAKFAEVFVTRNGKRNAMLMCKDFEGKANISTQDVPRMGSVIMGKKPTTVELSFTMTIYKCTEIFDDVVDELSKRALCLCSQFRPQTRIPPPPLAAAPRFTMTACLTGMCCFQWQAPRMILSSRKLTALPVVTHARKNSKIPHICKQII